MMAAAAPSTAATSIAAAAVSARLRQLADALDSADVQLESIGRSLQELALQLQGNSTPAALPAPAADVQQLECSFAAPAAPPHDGAPQQLLEQQADAEQPRSKKQRKAERPFVFQKYAVRFVALRLMYLGWSYQGFARQADSDNTIEGVLFPALRKVRLVPEDADISTLRYSRCGRTDKGVSALGQVLALQLRSCVPAGAQLPPPERELDYPALLNKVLPPAIRVLGWADAPDGFSARFSASHREYKYYIVQDGSLDVAAMAAAAAHLLGEHDFRHFCKADVAQVQNYKRTVLSVALEPAAVSVPGMSVLALYITGSAFLWHQVRCIAAVLLMVGRGQEQPGIVAKLLDPSVVPCKPQYSLADEQPLLLFHCGFGAGQQPAWGRGRALVEKNLCVVGGQLRQHLVAAALTSAVYEQLQQEWAGAGAAQQQPQQEQQHVQQQLQQGQGQGQQVQQQQEQQQQQQQNGSDAGRWVPPKPPHIPLLRRAVEPSIEERFEKAGLSLQLLNRPGGARDMDVG